MSEASLLDYQATLDCVHCGLCLPHCPTYQETGRETSSPRGRIYLMRGVAEERIPLDELVVDEMSFCLACRACESACPAGVRYGHLVEGMRAEIAARGVRKGLAPWLERAALRGVVAQPRRLAALFRVLRAYQNSGLQRAVRATRLLALVPPLRRMERMLPPLGEPHRPPVLVPASGARRGRVAFFAGCVMPEMFGAANAATVEVLARNGFEVEVPPAQVCCGALHRHAGDPEAADALHARNRAAFRIDAVDAVIVNSAGCGAAMRDAGDAFARKVRDATEFLADAGLRAPLAPLRLRVAYDDPCHLLHGQRIAAAPRALLRGVPGLELFDLPGCRDCCGAAGIYNLTQPEMSAALLARKVQALRDTRPDALATGNPGCLLQIGSGVAAAGLDVLVLHPLELLARAHRAASPT
ncbi:MAG TPA: (Fe-S)-binding protein [Myxococcota bacterium]|nr:(Fe-S)-binding protein [Myxococcota bacterium]